MAPLSVFPHNEEKIERGANGEINFTSEGEDPRIEEKDEDGCFFCYQGASASGSLFSPRLIIVLFFYIISINHSNKYNQYLACLWRRLIVSFRKISFSLLRSYRSLRTELGIWPP